MRTAILGGIALLATACGSDGAVCGAGTSEVDGECVPDETSVCGTGTVFTDGECVPDGTVICETGTTYDMSSGTCVPDITGCADGTVLVSGECVADDDTLVGDVMEPAEPNGFEHDATTPLLTLPAVGDDVVIAGCVEPRPDYDLSDNVDGDLDVYAFEASGPTLLDLTIDGVGGMSGAFFIFGFDAQGQLQGDNWSRQGLNLVGDTTQRQVFLPKAGTYLLVIADSRTFAFGQGVGDGTSTCYFATVANTALPTPTAISGTSVTGTLSGDAQFFSYDPDEADTVRATLDKVGISEVVNAGLVTMVDDAYVGSVVTSSPANDATNGLTDSSDLVFVVEESSNLGLTSTDFTLDLEVVGATLMPANGTIAVAPNTDDNLYYFDVATAGTALEITFDDNGNGGDTFEASFIGPRETNLGAIVQTATVDAEFIYVATPGRYYLQVTNNDTTETNPVNVTVGRSQVALAAVTQGAGATNVAISDWAIKNGVPVDNMGLVELDVAGARWLSYTITRNNFNGNSLGIAVPRATGTLSQLMIVGLTGGSPSPIPILGQDAGAIFKEDVGFGALVIVVDLAAGGGNRTFDISVDNQDFTDLNVIDEANPVSMTGLTLGADETKFFLFSAGADTDFDMTVTPDAGSNAVVDILEPNATVASSQNDAGTGAAENLSGSTENAQLLAFGVREATGLAGTFDLAVTATDPSYVRTTAGAHLDNACNGGTRFDADDFTDGVSAAQTLGFSFDFYGSAETEIFVMDTGWISFTAPTDSTLANFDHGVAAMGSDSLVIDDICIDSQATFVTVQWRGTINGRQTRFQATLRSTGVIEAGYAADNEHVESARTIGITNSGDSEPLPWRGELGDSQLITYTPKS